jgi:hypothetical protein
MIRSAVFSDDRKRRYELVRDRRDEIDVPNKTVLFVMLNPSKAGETDDDPTVRKVVGFARRWGYGRAVVVNLTPTVSTDPWELPYWNGIDMLNRAITQQWMGEVDLVVVAWGSPPKAICRTIAFAELVYSFCQIAPVDLYCIGTTRGGDPLHPSRAPYTDKPTMWRAYDETAT